MEISRTKAGELALFCIYDCLTAQHLDEVIDDHALKDIISNVAEDDFENVDVFIKDVTVKAILHQNEIIENVTQYLNKWTFDRLTLISQAIILYAYANYKYGKNADKATVIDSCIEFSKKYGDSKDYKFINAVLDKAL
jgi:N utilization substance protein B